MAESSLAPISDDEPCGEDLDFEEDSAYMQFTSNTEALLPDSYTVDDEEGTGKRVPFYTTQRFQNLDLGARVAAATRLLERTHDLRLLAMVAKLQILNRELPKFETTVATIAALLDRYRKEIHPRDAEGRSAALERLTEPLVLAALNHAVLFRSRRFGMVSWLIYLASTKGNDENAAGTENVDRILRDEVKADASSVIAAKELLGRLQGSLQRIVALCAEAGPSGQPNLQKLVDPVAAMLAMLDRVHGSTVAADQSGAVANSSPHGDTRELGLVPPSSALPLLPSAEAAKAALAEAARFFASVEPSSPTLLLLRQAQALVGRSFYEALQALLPDQIDKAKLSFGATPIFTLPLRQIAEANDGGLSAKPDAAVERKSPSRLFTTVTSRAEALSLLDQVGAFYRFVEPSSPVPLLVDRARALAGRDFTALLQAMLPEKKNDY